MKVVDIGIDRLTVNPNAQRTLRMGWARQLASKFDPALAGVLSVTEVDGEYLLVDGQHRVAAAKLAGYVGTLPCALVSTRTEADQARAFLALNNQKAVTGVEKFRVRVTAEDEVALEINDALAKFGWKIGSNAFSVYWLEQIYHKNGVEQLRGIAEIASRSWGSEAGGLSKVIIQGMAWLYRNRTWSSTRMIRALSATTPKLIIARANSAKELLGLGQTLGAAHALIDAYNKGLKRDQRIPQVSQP